MRQRITALVLALSFLLLAGCGQGSPKEQEKSREISSSLTYQDSMELLYAKEFSVDYYEGGYSLVTIKGSSRYLVIPEGKEAPADLAEDVVPLYQPLDRIYLVASAVMDMFISMDALDALRFTGTKAEGWYLPEAKEAVESGKLLYAGKYSAPDYEQILAEGCDLAIENTMIYHTPEVKEQLEKFGIPVIVDYSSYEGSAGKNGMGKALRPSDRERGRGRSGFSGAAGSLCVHRRSGKDGKDGSLFRYHKQR